MFSRGLGRNVGRNQVSTYGFHDVVDSEAMFARLPSRFREERIVP